MVTHFELSHERIEMPLPIVSLSTFSTLANSAHLLIRSQSDLKTVEGVQDSLEHLEYDSNGEAAAEPDVPGQSDDFFCLSSAEKEDVWK